MSHDVFISYSSENKSIANEVLTTLENSNIRCWIAPRDIPPGKLYGASLINAIKSAQIMILILSNGTNQSEYVVRELNEAVANGLTIISFRIEEVEPSENLGFYINSTQWLDAIDPPMENHLKKLADSVDALLSVSEKDQVQATEPVYKEPLKKRWSIPAWATILIAVTVVLILGGIGFWTFSRMGSVFSSTIPTESIHPTGVAEPTETTTIAEADESISETNLSLDNTNDWRPLTFVMPNPDIWRVSGEGIYTAILDDSNDAFAWSTEKFEGDLTVSLDLNSSHSTQSVTPNSGCVILYGSGTEFSYGSLIICVDYDGYYLQKHTRYRADEPLVFVPNDNDINNVYSVTIEIIDDLISVDVNGENVLASFFNLEEIDRKGRIGLFRNWEEGEITFSNLWVTSTEPSNTSYDADQSTPVSTSEPEADSAKQVVLVTHPDCAPPKISAADEIIVRVRWGATSQEIAESNADQFTFLFLLNGEDLGDIRTYRQSVEFYSGFEEYGCGPDRSIGWVHWDVPIGRLPAGTHTVAVEHILNETISDGLDTYPAGSLGIFEITFEVQP